MSTVATIIVMRWLHILSAIVMLGGAFFMRFVLHPVASATLEASQLEALKTALKKAWQRVVHICILLFLVSGFYNYLIVMRPRHQGQPLYHALFGVKFLLAMAVFLLAVLLTSNKPYSASLRAKTPFWAAIVVALGIGIVVISGVMKSLP